MNYFDFNIHIPRPGNFEEMIATDLSLAGSDLQSHMNEAIQRQPESCIGGNIMLFNQKLKPGEIDKITKEALTIKNKKIYFTLLASPYVIDSEAKLDLLKNCGVNSIKFHSYQQRITKSNYDEYIGLAKLAEKANMPIFIDTSYGSLYMYDYDNLDLAINIVKEVSRIPVILLHSGGMRALEAMLIAESAKNVFLDMSFSVHYYLNSLIEKNLAFAYKKIGSNRVLYGSDCPYINNRRSLESNLIFLERNGFKEDEKKMIMSENFMSIFE